MFIEPKGGDRLSNDDSEIKERFLLQIEKEHKLDTIFENKEFKLVGMPLYNEKETKTAFDKRLNEVVN